MRNGMTMRAAVALCALAPVAQGFGGPVLGATAVAGFLGWAFQGVGPSEEAAAAVAASPPTKVEALNGLLFGSGEPSVALYCGAKIRPESYGPLALKISEELRGRGVLVLQSPYNIYAFKPSTVAEVLAAYPSINCIAGHSIGGLWAAEFCADLEAWPENGLSFYYMGVHGKGVSLAPFRDLPFRKVGWSVATEDVTFQRCIDDDECDTTTALAEAYIGEIRDQLPATAEIAVIEGGNHEQYGSYGSPGYSKGLAYEDLVAKISAEDQCAQVAAAIAKVAAN